MEKDESISETSNDQFSLAHIVFSFFSFYSFGDVWIACHVHLSIIDIPSLPKESGIRPRLNRLEFDQQGHMKCKCHRPGFRLNARSSGASLQMQIR